MAGLKTKTTTASVHAFIKKITDDEQRADAMKLLAVFKEATGTKPVLWSNGMVGYGTYHYKSLRSTQEGDWPLTAWALRAQGFTIYIMPGFHAYELLLKKLGKHKVSGGSCLYITRLRDVHVPTLKTIIQKSVAEMKKRYPTKK